MEYPRVCLAKSQFGCRFDQSWFRPRDHVVQHVKGFFVSSIQSILLQANCNGSQLHSKK